MNIFGSLQKDPSKPSGFPGASFASEFEKAKLPKLNQTISESMRTALQLHIEETYERKIRKVVGFEELTKFGGGCNTCVYDYTEVDVYFKDWGGRLLKISIGDNFDSLVLNLSRKLGGLID